MTSPGLEQNAFTRNSLDLVRLVAASEVMFSHTLNQVPGVNARGFTEVLDLLPGVPLFFFISGFVISGAWNRNNNVRQYAIARLTRIFPPIVVQALVGLSLLVLLYDHQVLRAHAAQLTVWFASSIFMPVYNPQFLRAYGTGVMNGSLWTIPIEILFYVAAPLILVMGKRLGRPTWVMLAVIAVSLSLNTYAHYFFHRDEPDSFLVKLATISPPAAVIWLWMFCAGMLVQHWFFRIRPWLERNLLWLALATVVVTAASLNLEIPGLLRYRGNHMGLVNFIPVTLTALSFAYRFPNLSQRLLRGNDLSYGLYVFHMPVLNGFIEAGFTGPTCAALALTTSIVVASMSWFLIEKPSIKLTKELRSRAQARADAVLAEPLIVK